MFDYRASLDTNLKQWRSAGFTIIELLISLLLSSVILSVVVKLMVNSSISFQLQQSKSPGKNKLVFLLLKIV